MPSGRRAAVALLVTSGLLLAGCVPSRGAVHRVQPAVGRGPLAGQGIRVLAQPPRPGEHLDVLSRQFLLASADPDDDFAVARSFLVPEERDRWNPSARVSVFDGDVGEVQPVIAGGDLRITVPQSATIQDGDFELTPGATARLHITAVRFKGEWRFSHVPDGVLLSASLLFAFKPVDLYFFDPSLRRLVPDRVFLLASRRDLPDAALRALLRGPSPWLRGAVSSTIPTTARLAAPVQARAGVLNVDLRTGDGRVNRRALAGQVLWTAAQLPEVSGVRLRIDGVAYGSGSSPVTAADPDALGFDPDAVSASSAGYFVTRTRTGATLSNTDGERKPFLSGGVPMRHPAVSLDRILVAGLTCAGVRCGALYVGRFLTARFVRRLRVQGSLTPPTWAPDGTVWTVENRPGHLPRIWRIYADGRATLIPAPDLQAASVRAMRLARDGTRVALVADVAGKVAVLAGAVVPGDRGVAIRGLRPVAPVLEGAVDVGWFDSGRLVVLARSGQVPGSTTPYRVRVDGSDLPQPVLGTAPGGQPVSLAAAPGKTLLVGTETPQAATSSRVLQLLNQTWSLLPDGAGAIDPVYPG